jgi:hypothetical protein
MAEVLLGDTAGRGVGIQGREKRELAVYTTPEGQAHKLSGPVEQQGGNNATYGKVKNSTTTTEYLFYFT